MNSWIPPLIWRWYRQPLMPSCSGTTSSNSAWIWSKRVWFSWAILGGRGWFVARTRWRAKILEGSQLVMLFFTLGGAGAHLLAQGGNVAAFLDDTLAAVMVLVQLVAEVLED